MFVLRKYVRLFDLKIQILTYGIACIMRSVIVSINSFLKLFLKKLKYQLFEDYVTLTELTLCLVSNRINSNLNSNGYKRESKFSKILPLLIESSSNWWIAHLDF